METHRSSGSAESGGNGFDIVLDRHGQDRLLGAGFLVLITPTLCQ